MQHLLICFALAFSSFGPLSSSTPLSEEKRKKKYRFHGWAASVPPQVSHQHQHHVEFWTICISWYSSKVCVVLVIWIGLCQICIPFPLSVA